MKNPISKLVLLSLLIMGYSWASAQSDAEMELKSSVSSANAGEEFTVDITLKNPGAENIISVRSWLDYDPLALEAQSIETTNSKFTLSAPGEDNISTSDGRVKIGRSNIAGGVSETDTIVASVKFKVLATAKTTATISFYDYQVSELGHTSVNIIDEGFPLNILSDEPDALSISLNPNGTAASTTAPPVNTNPVITTPVNTVPTTTVNTSSLVRPTNLRVNTGNGYVDLIWDDAQDFSRLGYNVYYGQVSGQYSRRRTIGDFSSYRLDNLTNGQTYYFAITAYDSLNQESEYSNEVGVIINQPLSSTHPFASIVDNALASLPSQPQNGPLVGWLAFSAAGLSASVLFGRKKRKIQIKS